MSRSVDHDDEKHTSRSNSPSEHAQVDRDSLNVGTQEGVIKVEALQRVWTPRLKIALYIAIALAR